MESTLRRSMPLTVTVPEPVNTPAMLLSRSFMRVRQLPLKKRIRYLPQAAKRTFNPNAENQHGVTKIRLAAIAGR